VATGCVGQAATVAHQQRQQPEYVRIPFRANPTTGYEYRRWDRDPPNFLQGTNEPPIVKKPLLPLQPLLLQTVLPPKEIAIPRLQHDLERVLANQGVHPLREFGTKEYRFSSFLHNLHHPDEVNFDVMPPFSPSSQDKILLSLAREHQAKYIGSTSSVGPALAQMYHLLSKFNGIDFSFMSDDMIAQNSNFTKISAKPVCLILHKNSDSYAIDSAKGNILNPTNKILMDLRLIRVC